MESSVLKRLTQQLPTGCCVEEVRPRCHIDGWSVLASHPKGAHLQFDFSADGHLIGCRPVGGGSPTSQAQLVDAVAAYRMELGRPALKESAALRAYATTHASRLIGGFTSTEALADEVHQDLGANALAAVDAVRGSHPRLVRRFRGLEMAHWTEFGAAFVQLPGASELQIVVIYAARNAWPGTRLKRRCLRSGVAVFLRAFRRSVVDTDRSCRLYTGEEPGLEGLYREAAEACAMPRAEFRALVEGDPVLSLTLRGSMLAWQLGVEVEVDRAEVSSTTTTVLAGHLPIDL